MERERAGGNRVNGRPGPCHAGVMRESQMRTTRFSALAHQCRHQPSLSAPMISQIPRKSLPPTPIPTPSTTPQTRLWSPQETSPKKRPSVRSASNLSASVLGSRARNPTLFPSVGMRYTRYLVSVFSISVG